MKPCQDCAEQRREWLSVNSGGPEEFAPPLRPVFKLVKPLLGGKALPLCRLHAEAQESSDADLRRSIEEHEREQRANDKTPQFDTVAEWKGER